MKLSRDDFSHLVIETSKKRAAYICSNPNCKKMTIAPSLEGETKVNYIGNVSHVSAASPGGPRYQKNMSSEDRHSISNAIFLCNNCATMIDKNEGIDFPIKVLENWKKDHEKWVTDNLNKSISSTQPNNTFYSNNQSGGIAANNFYVESLNLQNNSDKSNHDRRIFNYNNQFLNESILNNLINSLKTSFLLPTFELADLKLFLEHMRQIDNDYLNQEIENLKLNLVNEITDILDLINDRFEGDTRSKKLGKNGIIFTHLIPKGLLPEFGQKLKKNTVEHDELINEINIKFEELKSIYVIYRRKVKQILSI